MSATTKSVWAKLATIRRLIMPAVALLVMIAATALPGFSQSNPDLQAFFQRDIGLSPDSIATLRKRTRVGRRRSPRDRLESATSVVHALSEADGTGQGQREGCDRDRTRAIGFYLGHGGKSRGCAEGDRTAGGMR